MIVPASIAAASSSASSLSTSTSITSSPARVPPTRPPEVAIARSTDDRCVGQHVLRSITGRLDHIDLIADLEFAVRGLPRLERNRHHTLTGHTPLRTDRRLSQRLTGLHRSGRDQRAPFDVGERDELIDELGVSGNVLAHDHCGRDLRSGRDPVPGHSDRDHLSTVGQQRRSEHEREERSDQSDDHVQRESFGEWSSPAPSLRLSPRQGRVPLLRARLRSDNGHRSHLLGSSPGPCGSPSLPSGRAGRPTAPPRFRLETEHPLQDPQRMDAGLELQSFSSGNDVSRPERC